ncbi:mitochondrial carrier domain-containing protein [Microdochium bolleyi]|uniref:Mitochondrial carrier domain-containing protein n=1 Tax=Microdochium bolleyi TaxID=196109 RepID=A0A136J6S0_9PEZI|nr:mitochondrial carrier domain-containing protein [Microdochium bolleyi]
MVGGGSNASTSPLMSLCAGGIAGGVEAASTYPFEFAKTRVQLYGHDRRPGYATRNPFAIVLRVARDEGPRALYKGCSTMIVGSVGKDAVRFLAFDTIRAAFEDQETGTLGAGGSILSGMAAGVVSSTVVVTPSERIKTALIDDAKTTRRFKGAVDCVRTLTREQGILGALWRGYVTTTLKQIGTTGFRLGSYSTIKDWERRRGINVDSLAVSFANGAVAGTVTTLATQPFDTVKTMAQQAKQVGTMEVFRAILAEDGVRGLWRGTVMRLGRTVLAGGILFTANEQALKMLKFFTGQ